ncbi:hypothetical protein DSAG12_02847 [Promethearchaeum syntrophicum]|uniref:Uncharacterized protein n=1 Tax=Promethearchaeum syntrophicum TaxID=2594042 RepID=A0A5B9DDE6_9ARCH|nr:hypothetical protein [Candidatus Prometheoarchaeum syntrophicum]QEE17015.1 hypothetical protein DSAG12_02847 [Candidatus Prometheoarchaeum syntrophicum]
MIKAIAIPGFFDIDSNAFLEEWGDWINEFEIKIDIPLENYNNLFKMLYEEEPSHKIGIMTQVLAKIFRNLSCKNHQLKPCDFSLRVSLKNDFLEFIHGFLHKNNDEPFILLLSHLECGDLNTTYSCACSSLKPCTKIRIIQNIDDLKSELVNLWNIQVHLAIERTPPSRRGRTEDLKYYSKIFLKFLNNNELNLHYKYLKNVEALSDEDILKEMLNLGISETHRVDLVTIHSNQEMIFIEAKSDSSFDSLKDKFRCTKNFIEKYKNDSFPTLKAIGVIHNDHFIPKKSHSCKNGILYKKISTKQEKMVDSHNIPWHMFNERNLRKN